MSAVDVRGEEQVLRMLRDYTEPLLRRRVTTALTEGAKVFVPPLRGEARKVSRRMGRAVTTARTPKSLVSSSTFARVGRDPAVFVGFRRKTAWFSHIVIGGSSDHGPRRANALAFRGRYGVVVTKSVRGVPPNPMVGRVATGREGRALEAIERSLDRTEST